MFTGLAHTAARLRAFFRTRDLDGDFDQELASHLAMLTEDNMARGMTPAEARRAAWIHTGGPASLKEQHRAVRGLPAMDSITTDILDRLSSRSSKSGLRSVIVVSVD